MRGFKMDGFKFYGSATIGTKGQIVIPAEARETLGFKEGDKVIAINAPFGEGLLILKSEIFEKMIGNMQSKLTVVTESINKSKDQK
jgi:AbrB family looped-hinge helix DNA binding protein